MNGRITTVGLTIADGQGKIHIIRKYEDISIAAAYRLALDSCKNSQILAATVISRRLT